MSSKNEPKAAEERKSIEVILGPDRGARWLVDADFGEAAISEGWARDTMAPPPEAGAEAKAEPEPLTPERRETAIAAAIKAARKLRGEPDEDEQEASGEYETSDMQPRRGPGRPRKSAE